MKFENFFSNDIESIAASVHYIQRQNKQGNSLLNYKQKLILKIALLMLLGMIIFFIVKYVQCSKMIKFNEEQQFYNYQQISVNQDLSSQANAISIIINDKTKEVNELKERLSKAEELYKSLAKKTPEDSEMIQRSLQDQINEAKRRSEVLRMKHRDFDESLIELNTKQKNHQWKKEKLLKTIDGLEQDLLHQHGHSEHEVEGPYGSTLIKTEKNIALLTQGLEKEFLMKLIYRGTSSSNSLRDYYHAVSHQGVSNTLVVIKIRNGDIIGGFTYNNWSKAGFNTDHYAFLFNLSSSMIFKIHTPEEAIMVDYNSWPIFGAGDLSISSFDACTSNFPNTYGDEYSRLFLTGGRKEFEIEQLEVFILFSP